MPRPAPADAAPQMKPGHFQRRIPVAAMKIAVEFRSIEQAKIRAGATVHQQVSLLPS